MFALGHLLTAKRHELELLVEMLRRRGSNDFLALSLKLYGAVSPALLGDAEALLDCVSVPAVERGERLDAEAFARRAELELDHYRATGVDIKSRVEVRSDSSGVMVSNGNLLIAPTVTVPESHVHALLQHEIGTHIVTHVNGSHQPLRLLGAGLADNDETQEGLAVFAEYLAGGLTARRLRQLADARIIAVHQMTDGGVVHGHTTSRTRRQRGRPGRGIHYHDAGVPIGRVDQGRGVPAGSTQRRHPRRCRRGARRAVARKDGAQRRPPHRGPEGYAAPSTNRC